MLATGTADSSFSSRRPLEEGEGVGLAAGVAQALPGELQGGEVVGVLLDDLLQLGQRLGTALLLDHGGGTVEGLRHRRHRPRVGQLARSPGRRRRRRRSRGSRAARAARR